MNKENSSSNMKSLRAFFSGKGKGKKEDALAGPVIAKKAPLQAAATPAASAAAAVPVPASEGEEESKQEPAVVIEAVLPSVALDADAASASFSAAASPAPSCITNTAGSPPFAFVETEMAQNSPVIETHAVSEEPVHASGVDTPVPDRREVPNALLTPQRTSKKIKATDVTLFEQQQQQVAPPLEATATSEQAATPTWKKPLLALAAFALLLLISCSFILLPPFTSSIAQITSNKTSISPSFTSSFSSPFLPSSSSPAVVASSLSTTSYPFESTRIVANVKMRFTKLINKVFFAPFHALKATWSALTSRLKRVFGNK